MWRECLGAHLCLVVLLCMAVGALFASYHSEWLSQGGDEVWGWLSCAVAPGTAPHWRSLGRACCCCCWGSRTGFAECQLSGTCAPCPRIPGICVPAAPSASCLPPSATRGLLSILLQTMDSWVLWFLLLQSLVQYPQPAGDGLDEVMCLWTELHAKLQEQERIRMERELEQLMLKLSGTSWGDLLRSALHLWQVWVSAGLLLLLLALWFIWRKRICQAQSSGQEENEEDDKRQEYDLGWLLEERIQLSLQDLQGITALMDNFTSVLRCVLRHRYFNKIYIIHIFHSKKF